MSLNILVIYFDFSCLHGRCWRHTFILFLRMPPGGLRHTEATNSLLFQLSDDGLGILKSIQFFSSEIEDKYCLI